MVWHFVYPRRCCHPPARDTEKNNNKINRNIRQGRVMPLGRTKNKLLNCSTTHTHIQSAPAPHTIEKKPMFVSVDLAMKAVRSFRCILAESLAPEQPILWCRVLFCVYNDGMLGHRTCNEATCDAMHPPALPFLPFSKSILNDFPHTHTTYERIKYSYYALRLLISVFCVCVPMTTLISCGVRVSQVSNSQTANETTTYPPHAALTTNNTEELRLN